MAKTKEKIVNEARERISKLESSGGFVWTAKDQVLFTHLCDIANQGSDGWISVEDVLPEVDQDFICWGVLNGERKPRIYKCRWSEYLQSFSMMALPINVSHYRPLPSPPQSQSK